MRRRQLGATCVRASRVERGAMGVIVGGLIGAGGGYAYGRLRYPSQDGYGVMFTVAMGALAGGAGGAVIYARRPQC